MRSTLTTLFVSIVSLHADRPADEVFKGIAPMNAPSLVKLPGMPSFDVNLDMPPEGRWMHIASHYRDQLIDHIHQLVPEEGTEHMKFSKNWLHLVPFDQEYEAELMGMVKAVAHPHVTLERMKWLNMLYEMDSPLYNPGCTGILWAKPDGTVIQGRNADDFNTDINHPEKHMSQLVFDVHMYKLGKKFMSMTMLPGRVGLTQGMRYGSNRLRGWAFAQNKRTPNDWQTNFAAGKRNGQVQALAARRIMEQTEDFNTAVSWLSTAQFMAPHYFIVSGVGPGQGAVLSVDRLGQRSENTPIATQLLMDSMSKVEKNNLKRDYNWFLVQTNDDIDKAPEYDMRRPFANRLLSTTSQQGATEEHMLQFLHTTPMMNPATMVTTVMVPATGYYKSILPTELPSIVDGDGMDQMLFESEFLQSYPLLAPSGSYNAADHLGAASLLESAEETKPLVQNRTHRRFLDWRMHRHHKATIDHPLLPVDEVSFIQLSRRLEL